MPTLVMILLSVALAGLPALAAAAPRTIDDCERIEAADAYNRCLALFGPPGRSLRLEGTDLSGGTEAAPPAANAEADMPRGKKARMSARHGHGALTASGRLRAHHATFMPHRIRAKRMVFSVVSGHTRMR